MKKIIIILLPLLIVLSVVIYFVVNYLQLPFRSRLIISYDDTKLKPFFSRCDWRTNFYGDSKIDVYYKMLEKESPIAVAKSGDIIRLTTTKSLGLKTEKYQDKNKVFIGLIGNANDLDNKIVISDEEIYKNTTVNMTSKDFNIQIKLPLEEGYYDYLIGTFFNAGLCEHTFKIKVEK